MNRAIVPPPWRLSGAGYVLVLFPQSRRVSAGGGLDPRTIPRIQGFGVVMLLDYSSSDAGPYRELLYIPGRASVRVPRRVRGHSISHIFVTTELSRDSGEENWGIPKQLGGIDWGSPREGRREILLSDAAGHPVFGVRLRSRPRGGDHAARLALPFSHRFLPRTLVQTSKGALYTTSIEATGRVRPITGVSMIGYDPLGEEIADRRIAAAFQIVQVQLLFPHPSLRTPIG